MPGDTADRDAVMAGWTKGQIACRARERHVRWSSRSVELHVGAGAPYYLVIEMCTSCRSMRFRPMDTTGFWLDRWKPFKYSQGYLLPPGGGRLADEERAPLRIREYIENATITEVDDSEE